MSKKIFISLFIVLDIILILGCIINFFNPHKNEIESKTVWITAEVEELSNYSEYGTSNSYFVRYDDHNGETGILYTNRNGNNLHVGDVVTVYRSLLNPNSTDSTHGWNLSTQSIVGNNYLAYIFTTIYTIILIIVLFNLKKRS